MPRFAANLSMLYTELPFLDRYAAAADDGFAAAECLFPYDTAPDQLRRVLQRAGMVQVLINTPPGDWSAGERGLAAVPGREAVFVQLLEQAIAYALEIGCPQIHLMAGCVPAGCAYADCEAIFEGNLRHAVARLEASGLVGLIEPINRRDIPGYFLNTQAQARALIDRIGSSALRLQMDLYHCQIVEGDLANRIRCHLPVIAHMQIAGVPQRHEPDIGELNYPYLFALLDQLGYRGWIGCEYRPHADTSAGLGWLREWRDSQG